MDQVRHTRFYFSDGSAIFLVGKKLYKLHMSFLQPHSPVCKRLFSIHGNSESPAQAEGLSDENPILLGDPFTESKFDNLLGWYYRIGDSPSPPLNSYLRDILELATFLEWEHPRWFAINAMDHVVISPAMKLSLAVRFGVEEWIAPAFRDLMAVPTHELTREDFTELGDPLCHLIVTTQAAINHHRLVVADNLLKLPHPNTSCGTLVPTDMCRYNLEVAWRDGLARHYRLHPKDPASPQVILYKLGMYIHGVTRACQQAAIETIREQRLFEAEDDLREETLAKIKQLQKI